MDDNLNKYPFIIEGLEKKGLSITQARSIDEAKSKLSQPHDVYLIDIKLAEDDDGIDFAEHVHQTYSDARLVFLSAYLHQEYWRKRLQQIKMSAGILEKDFGGDVEAVADTLATQIKKWAADEPNLSPAEYYEMKLQILKKSPFRLTREKFEALPEYQQDQLAVRVRKEAAQAIKAAFGEGAVWVLLSGSRVKPIEVRFKVEDIPDEKEFRELTRGLKYAYFEYQRDYGAEGLAWAGPCSSSDLTTYPTLTLLLEKAPISDQDNEGSFGSGAIERRNIHFDTGSPETLLDYEMLVEYGLMQPTSRRSQMLRVETRESFFAHQHDVSLLFAEESDESNSKAIGVVIRVLAVRDWWNSPWRRRCDAECGVGKEVRKARYCINRCGLLGRNILSQGRISIELNGATGNSKVKKNDI